MTLPAHLLPPLPSEALASADHDRAWDIIAAHVEAKRVIYVGGTIYPSTSGRYGRARTMPGRWERAAAVCEEDERLAEGRAREDEERARWQAALSRMSAERQRLMGDGDAGRSLRADPATRCAAYLGTMGTGARGAFDAVHVAVKGFGLGASDGLALVVREYLPRYHRRVQRWELPGMVKRAMGSRLPWGWLLEKGRRT